MCDVNVKDSPK